MTVDAQDQAVETPTSKGGDLESDPADKTPLLTSALRAIDTLTVPAALANHQVEYDGENFLKKNFKELPRVYGLNTLPGHRVSETVAPSDLVKFQFNLIANHRLGSGPYLDDKTARAVTYAKLFAATSGHTLISKSMYEGMLRAATSPAFRPHIPQHASYSAGDVIPAAHWAQDLLDWGKNEEKKDPQLLPGEGMALINGSFVHVGVTLSLVRQLRDFWGMYIDTAESSFKLLGADARTLSEPSTADNKWFRETMQRVRKSLEAVPRSSEVQDPVSIRTFPQQTQAAIFAIQNLITETNAVLDKPSGNPVMLKKEDGSLEITPSGSFDQASLALATSNVIEALMMIAWQSVRRTVHMLDGDHAGLPKDGVTDNDHLAMIQWPKLAQAKLEELRSRYGIRNFTSGSSTSEEIEDFWTNGTETSLRAMDLLRDVEHILMIERMTAERLGRVQSRQGDIEDISLRNIDDETVARVKSKIDYKEIPFPLKL